MGNRINQWERVSTDLGEGHPQMDVLEPRLLLAGDGAWLELAKVVAGDGAAYGAYGTAVSLSGTTAIVGASGDNQKGLGAGAAYIVGDSGTGWQQAAKLVANDGEAGDAFGFSVAIDGNLAIVGAWRDDDKGEDAGSAYIFQYIGAAWQQVAKLTADDGQAKQGFGLSVWLSGDTAVVGAPNYLDPAIGPGAAYVFQDAGAGWQQVVKLAPGDGAAEDLFGFSVSISDGTVLVGSPKSDPLALSSGSAYVFRNPGAGWQQTAKLTPDDGAEKDWFGYSVSIASGVAAIGAFGDDLAEADCGSAYIFRDTGAGWTQEAKLTADTPKTGDWYGFTIAIHGDRAVVGAPLVAGRSAWEGAAFIYHNAGGTWTQQAKLTASDHAWGDKFGSSVAVFRDTAIVGAPQEDAKGDNSGGAYIYQVTQVVTIGDAHAGSVSFLDADGTLVTVSFKGGGTADAHFLGDVQQIIEGKTAAVLGANLRLQAVALHGTNPKSALSFATKGGLIAGSTVGGITADAPVKSIVGKTVSLLGSIVLDGPLATLQLDDVADGHLIEINAKGLPVGAKEQVAITFDRVTDTAVNTHNLPIKSITVTEWANTPGTDVEDIQAPWIGKITTKGFKGNAKAIPAIPAIPGDFTADLVLSGAGVLPKKPTLGTVKIAGSLVDSLWKVTGSMGKVTVTCTADDSKLWSSGTMAGLTLGASDGSEFVAGGNLNLAGVKAAANLAAGDFADPLASIASIAIKGLKLAKGAPIPTFLTDSCFAGPSLGAVSLMNGDAPFKARALLKGVDPNIKSVSHKDTRDPKNPDRNWKWSPGKPMPVGGDGVIEGIL